MSSNSSQNIQPKVSVIIPVYNVERYIEKCARSIFEQTLDSLEIIFVDDCSPDNSVEIIKQVLENYPKRRDQTKIIKMPSNAGQAGVRRRGILESTGEYIIHCDGDDWVDAELYEKMYSEASKSNADVVFCDEVLEYNDKSIPMNIENLPEIGKDLIKNWYVNIYGLFCHNKLVRTSIYKENNILPWEDLNMWEDNGLLARLLYHSNKISQIHGPVYHYNRTNVNAMTAGYGLKQVNQMIGIASNLAEFFNSKPDAKDFENTVNAFKYLARINLVTDSFKSYKWFLKTFPESKYIAKKLDSKAFSTKGRFRFNMVRFGLAPLFILMFKVRNKIRGH